MVTRHRRVVHQWTRVTEMLCPNRGSSLTSTSQWEGLAAILGKKRDRG
jgi:hypothetical protein